MIDDDNYNNYISFYYLFVKTYYKFNKNSCSLICVCVSIFKQRNRRGGGGASDFKCIFIKHIKASTICKSKLAINGMVYAKCVWYFMLMIYFMDFTEVEFKFRLQHES